MPQFTTIEMIQNSIKKATGGRLPKNMIVARDGRVAGFVYDDGSLVLEGRNYGTSMTDKAVQLINAGKTNYIIK